MVKISAVIITYNEENNIKRCLESLDGVADQILVVDSFSTDHTPSICHGHGVDFLQHSFAGHIEQKNYAMEQARFPIILSLDADEALSDTLTRSIVAIKQNWRHDGYYFNRMTRYCGQWIKHCGWYPDRKLRLWDRDKGKWGGENPHDKVILQENTTSGNLKGDLLHYSYNSIWDHADTTNKYSEIAAKEALKKNKKVNFLIHILLNPIFTFFKKYIMQRGFLDGYFGFVICVMSAYGKFLKYVKIKEQS